MASLPFFLLIGSAFCVLLLIFVAARRLRFPATTKRNRPAETVALFARDDAEYSVVVRSDRRMLGPVRASVTRRRSRRHAIALPH